MNGFVAAIRPGHAGPHGSRIFLAEIEDMANFDAAQAHQLISRHRTLIRIMHFISACIKRCEAVNNGLQILIIIDLRDQISIQPVLMKIDPAFTGLSQNDEFMAHITADRTGISLHRNGCQAHSGKGFQIGYEHPVIGRARTLRIGIE